MTAQGIDGWFRLAKAARGTSPAKFSRKVAMFLMVAAMATVASAQTFTTLATFDGTNGESPYGSLIQVTNGSFYGTTRTGGAHNYGTVFQITAGALTTLYSFCVFPCTDGDLPQAGLVQGSDGNFYGTTFEGGANNNGGTVFQITPAGTLTTLYSFCSIGMGENSCVDGSSPDAGLVQGSDGNFYGTTENGGNGSNCSNIFTGCGTIFKITAAGKLTTLYTFCSLSGCSDGGFPEAGLVQGSDGNFYGTTSSGGGASSDGTVFKITPTGTLTTLYSFCAQTNCTDGATPSAGLVQGSDGNFYGTTNGGGANGNDGTVFKITPGGTLTTLYSFCAKTSCTDGANPNAGLVQASDGNFYGTTYAGGTNDKGTVFKLTSSGTLTTLYSFCFKSSCSDGEYILGGLVQAMNGSFYGTTWLGGADGDGTVFSLSTGLFNFPAMDEQVDYFKEGKASYTVWRPSDGTFYILDSSGKKITTAWGKDGDVPVIGDYDGDRKTDTAIWRPSTGEWWVIESRTGQKVTEQWGETGDIPVPGDYDGDGRTDYAIFRPSTGTWWILESSTGKTTEKVWGETGDIPVPGDYDGDGKTDIAIWRPSTATWWISQSSNGQTVTKTWGETGDIPVPGDYDGEGKTDTAIWRPSTGEWWIKQSNGAVVTKVWGQNGDVPVARDYDGDGKTDYAVWRPSTGEWWVIQSSNNGVKTELWGESTDIPVNQPVGR